MTQTASRSARAWTDKWSAKIKALSNSCHLVDKLPSKTVKKRARSLQVRRKARNFQNKSKPLTELAWSALSPSSQRKRNSTATVAKSSRISQATNTKIQQQLLQYLKPPNTSTLTLMAWSSPVVPMIAFLMNLLIFHHWTQKIMLSL